MDVNVMKTKDFKLPPARPGLCAVCDYDHAEDMAHHLHNFFYETRFRKQYGRAPTWADACAHLSDKHRWAWRTMMEGLGEWAEPSEGTPIAEPYVMAT